MASRKIKIAPFLSQEVLNEDLHDFRIQLDDGGEVSCHKFIIYTQSPVIKGMIPLKKYHEAKSIRLDGYKTEDIQRVVGLLETGSLIITDAEYFMSILESLQIPAELEALQDPLKTENQDSPASNAISIDYDVLVKYKDSPKVLCQICGNDFASMRNAEGHYRSRHGPSQDRVNCRFCGRSYKNQASLVAHRIQKHNIRVSQLEKKKSPKPNVSIKKE